MLSQITMNINSLCIRTPRTGQIHLLSLSHTRQFTAYKNIAIFFALICRRSGNIPITQTMDGAILKQCRRPAKNKIHRTLYITMVIKLTTVFAISVQSILISQKTTVFEISAISTNKTGHCLPHSAGTILESDILSIEIGSINITG